MTARPTAPDSTSETTSDVPDAAAAADVATTNDAAAAAAVPDVAAELALEQAHVDRVYAELEKASRRAADVEADGLARGRTSRSAAVDCSVPRSSRPNTRPSYCLSIIERRRAAA